MLEELLKLLKVMENADPSIENLRRRLFLKEEEIKLLDADNEYLRNLSLTSRKAMMELIQRP